MTDRSLNLYESLSPQPSGRHVLYHAAFDGQVCALKGFTLANGDSQAFLRELSMLRRLQHPRIVPLQAAFIDSSQHVSGQHAFIQMPWFSRNLEQWAAEQQSEWPVRRALYEALEGLDFVHKSGVIHGDIKPTNVLIDNGHARLADFGTSKRQSLSTSRGPGGTLHYMAPEVQNGDEPTWASDVFSAGIMFHILEAPSLSSGLGEQGKALKDQLCRHRASKRISAARACQHEFFTNDSKEDLPCEWSEVPPAHYACVRMDLRDNLAQQILAAACNTFHGSSCRGPNTPVFDVDSVRSGLVNIHRVENSILWRSYAASRRALCESALKLGVNISPLHPPALGQFAVLDSRLNEVYLFHGSSHVDTIVQEGLDPRVSNDKSLYGRGSYFTDRLCKALQYAHADDQGLRRVVFCRVLLGDAYYTDTNLKNLKVPPRREVSERRCDSVVAPEGILPGGRGQRQRHREFVVFEKSQSYPEFVLTFRLH
eukprot:TRINITY_DN67905_c0_g1_i1.p1 TRINITY_DN67905_c0_g1~~TRINITY_DN67905_c0_g1_i1.p1  ORF type:complete len:511 (+),score=80.29 TRINITY_DN67905_c0_g1_i1:86-1534(+)